MEAFMFFSKPKVEWKWYGQELLDLERMQHNVASLRPVKLDPDAIKEIGVCHSALANSITPILATSGIYNCVGLLAYDQNKKYAFLAHSYGNERYGHDNSMSPSQIYDGSYYRVPKGVIHGSSIHAIEMLDTLSKKELYELKFAIIVGSKPNLGLVSSMINTIINSRRKNISIESIELIKPFVDGIHKENDVNHGKDIERYDLCRAYGDKDIVENSITGEIHSYDISRGSSLAFDSRDGEMYTYNFSSNQYYSYSDAPSVEIRIR